KSTVDGLGYTLYRLTRAPGAASRSASPTAAGSPEHSTTASQPSAAAASAGTGSAPSAAASSALYRLRTTATTRDTDLARKACTARAPTGPSPTTATRSPGPTPARRTACTAHAIGSASTAVVRSSPSGTRC